MLKSKKSANVYIFFQGCYNDKTLEYFGCFSELRKEVILVLSFISQDSDGSEDDDDEDEDVSSPKLVDGESTPKLDEEVPSPELERKVPIPVPDQTEPSPKPNEGVVLINIEDVDSVDSTSLPVLKVPSIPSSASSELSAYMQDKIPFSEGDSTSQSDPNLLQVRQTDGGSFVSKTSDRPHAGFYIGKQLY